MRRARVPPGARRTVPLGSLTSSTCHALERQAPNRKALMLRSLITIGIVVLLTMGAIALGVKFFDTSVHDEESRLD